ncbi:uncharacterized protein LOC143021950 isoform X2 [Oratosquilla oratoria]|uniref:uncharacterized protein LOC143021950 isoform X2 n=1 Tax=Oratosquilla oratoria TaxID=337810 RepID=UPI003F763000
MAFNRYKKRTIQFQSSENSRAVRAVKYAENRKTKRGDVLFQRRQMDLSSSEDSIIETSLHYDKENKDVAPVFHTKKTVQELAEERYQKLLKWRDEKRKMLEVEKRLKKPAFKTGLYHPENPKYLVSDTEKIPPESKLNMTHTPAKCSSTTKPAKVWHNVSSTVGTPSQAQMKPILRFRTGVTPSLGCVKPKVLRGLNTPQNETRAPLRASSRLQNRFSKGTPIRKTSYKKKKISNVITDKEPIVARNKKKKENVHVDTTSFMTFAPENFMFEAPKGIDTITLTEFGLKSSSINVKDSKVLQPARENHSECEEGEIFYPAEDFYLDEEKAPKMTTFFSSRNQDQYLDVVDEGIKAEEYIGNPGQLLEGLPKENDCVDYSAEKESDEEEKISMENEDVDKTEESIEPEEIVETECVKENEEIKGSGVEDNDIDPVSGTDDNDRSPEECLDQSSGLKVSTEGFRSPFASKPSKKNTTPESLSPLHQSLSLEKSSNDNDLKSLLLKIPNCHHEHEEILVSPVRPRTRRSFALAQQALTPHNQPIRVQTPCSRKTRRSLVAHSDLSPGSLVYTPDTKPGRRRSMRRTMMTPKDISGSSTYSDDTKENVPHQEPTPRSHRKSKCRRSSRGSFLRDVPVESQGVLLEVDESIDEKKMSIIIEKESNEVTNNEIATDNEGLQTPRDTQKREPASWLITDSPFVTVTRGSSSKKRRGGETMNDLKGLFDDIPTDGSPLPDNYLASILGQLSPDTRSKEGCKEQEMAAQDPTCTNLLAVLESTSSTDITDSENEVAQSNLVTPLVSEWKADKVRRSVTFSVEKPEDSTSFKFPVTPLHSSTRKTAIKNRSRVSLLPGLSINSPNVIGDSVHEDPPTMQFFSLDTPVRDTNSSGPVAVTPRRSRRLSKAVL